MFWVENLGEVKVNKYHQRSQITVSGLMVSRLCPRMHLSGAIAVLLVLFSSTAAHKPGGETKETQSFYLLAVTSQAVGGTNETLCVTITSPRPVFLTVDFKLKESSVKLLEDDTVQGFYRCITFQVPVVTQKSVASINLQIKDSKNDEDPEYEKSTEILIIPPSKLLLIETDKPIYKPGQTVKFRIVSLDSDFYTYNQVDPNSNRIGQWLNTSTTSGMVDLSFPLNSRANNGFYTITVWKNSVEQIIEQFEVREYGRVLVLYIILPTFEVKVEVPEVITILEKNFLLKICAKYTYGKPVSGEVGAVVCQNGQGWHWFSRHSSSIDLCKNYTMQTDKTGCGQQVLNLKHFAIGDSRYNSFLDIQSEVTEHGTGVVMKGSGRIFITNTIMQISFEDSPITFRPGMMYKGKVKITDANSNPVKRKSVNLTLRCNNTVQNQRLVTNDNGVAEFSYDTKPCGLEEVSITADYDITDKPYEYTPYQLTPCYAPGYHSVQPFYSRSQSYITIEPKSTPLSCENVTNVEFDYVIKDKIYRKISFFYMVMSRGHLVYEGRVSVDVKPKSEIKGTASFRLTNVNKLSPHAQVVVYTLLSSGEVVADSMNFPVQPCLTNKVFNMLPIQMLREYPYPVEEQDPYPCRGTQYANGGERSSNCYSSSYGKTNVHRVFREIGVKILTNAEIRPEPVCTGSSSFLRHEAGMRASALAFSVRDHDSIDENRAPKPNKPIVTVRKYFPETWIWDLVSVGRSGGKVLNKTVPDSITTWQADAFCTSPIGFGVAPKAELVSFQPFFVSVTMPSSVIRGEVFTLKATVFNYLQSCITDFSAERSKDYEYSRCLCADESFTVSWTITPLVLGQVNINVTAEASDRAVTTSVSLTLPNNIVEGSAEASVSVVGDPMGRALQNLARLLAMPSGCGEQNMIRFAPNIYILQYLESTNQLTPEILSTTNRYLVTGYQNQLNYKRNDGSYSAFGMSDPSGNTWLTAFVMKSFGSAMRYIFIDQVFVDQAKNWLGQQQQSNGCFASVGQLFNTDMKGGVNDEVTLTAYIAAAMLELNYTITDPILNQSLTCLRNQYSQVTSTYAKALLFYTFTLAGDQAMRLSLISSLDAAAIVSGGGRHWSRFGNASLTDSLEVEMTSYVLLALMSGPQLSGFGLGYSTSIVYWISQKQNAFGGYASTQDTVVALQALAKYSQATYSPAGNITVTVTSPSGQRYTFSINQSNRLLYQEKELQEVPGAYSIKADGKGCVYVQFAVSYNIPPPPQNNSAFSLSASANGNCRVPYPSLEVTINVKYNGTRPSTNMAVIEVRPLSGFEVDLFSVKLLKGNSVVQLVEIDDDIIVIYLDGLEKGKENQLTLTITAAKQRESAVTQYSSPCPYQYTAENDEYSSESETENEEYFSESEIDHDEYSSESELEDDKNLSEPEKESETEEDGAERKNETNPHKLKNKTNPAESKKENEKNPAESEEKNQPESEKENETNSPESEKEDKTNPPESKKENETNSPESEKENETNPPESEKENEINPPESEKEKETNPTESEKEKETNPPESEKENETNPPESEKENEINPPESEKDRTRSN
ncbi:Alpha-2-macroglobulin-like protein 1 [Bagarius yarrelli]|uniref:Alpha-2-macroglobulin-like protein 1 n=1 Tax=Bagarius yarrelli TaxID=175774 RepID=A0A556VUH6_BAGYA|nr:Alpha-2-macroglobulin-like protein 1 [Bagarius yarrelli]